MTSADRPLTPMMTAVLRAMDELSPEDYVALTPAHIAMHMNLDAPRRLGADWSGWMNPAQRIIGPLTALRRRGLIGSVTRRDGLAGQAYYLTGLSREIARTQ